MAEIVPAPNTGPIRIPEWDDVMHVKPRVEINKETRKAWNAYLQTTAQQKIPIAQLRERTATDAAQLQTQYGIGDAELRTLLRGRQLYQDFSQSAIPGWRKQMVKALTVLDNIEDQVSTIEWATRPLTRLWAPTKWLSKVARRTNDAVSKVESIIAGPTIAKWKAKDRAARKNRRTADSIKGKRGKVQQMIALLGASKGQLLEAGQAMDTWTGIGISLGSIFGAIEETQDRALMSAWESGKFTVAEAARQFTTPGSDLDEILMQQQDESMDELRRVGVPLAEQLMGYAQQTRKPFDYFTNLVRAYTSSAAMQTDPATYTPAERAIGLYNTATLGPLLGEILAPITTPSLVQRILDLDAPTLHVRDSYARDLLDEAGATIAPDGEPTGEWQEPTVPVSERVLEDVDLTLAAMKQWLPPTEEAEPDRLLHALVEANEGNTSWLVTGREDGIHYTHDPDTRAELLMQHLDAFPPPGTTEETVRAWFQDQRDAIAAHGDDYDWRTWRDVTRRHWNVDHLYPSTTAAPSKGPLDAAAAEKLPSRA